MSRATHKVETAKGLRLPSRAARPLGVRLADPPREVCQPEWVPERRDMARRQRLLHRIEEEYAEMPGLRLTLTQAQRLFGLPEDACTRVLNALVSAHVLRRHENGLFTHHSLEP